jgi:hypothetical protein
VALFIFHGASRDSQAGVAAKPSPLVAFVTKLLKRKLGSKKQARVAPAAQPDELTEMALVHSDSDDDGDGFTVHPAPALVHSDSDDDGDGFTVHPAPGESSRFGGDSEAAQ